MYIFRQSVIKDYQIVKLMFEVNAFIVTYLITEIMAKFIIQQFKPFLCDQVIISEVITFTLVLISYLIKCHFLSSATVSN